MRHLSLVGGGKPLPPAMHDRPYTEREWMRRRIRELEGQIEEGRYFAQMECDACAAVRELIADVDRDLLTWPEFKSRVAYS